VKVNLVSREKFKWGCATYLKTNDLG